MKKLLILSLLCAGFLAQAQNKPNSIKKETIEKTVKKQKTPTKIKHAKKAKCCSAILGLISSYKITTLSIAITKILLTKGNEVIDVNGNKMSKASFLHLKLPELAQSTILMILSYIGYVNL